MIYILGKHFLHTETLAKTEFHNRCHLNNKRDFLNSLSSSVNVFWQVDSLLEFFSNYGIIENCWKLGYVRKIMICIAS